MPVGEVPVRRMALRRRQSAASIVAWDRTLFDLLRRAADFGSELVRAREAWADACGAIFI